MKHLILSGILAVLIFAVLSLCAERESLSARADVKSHAKVIDGTEFVYVPASVFTFNETANKRLIDGATVPAEVFQSAFWITAEPVSISVLQRYAKVKGNSYDDIQKALTKMRSKTRVPAELATEAMLEAAIKGGYINPTGTQEILTADGWNTIDEKQEHRTVIKDWFVPRTEKDIVLRTKVKRSPTERYRRRGKNTFYLVIKGEPKPSAKVKELLESYDYRLPIPSGEPFTGKAERFVVGDATFTMLPVKGGSMTLGGTDEQKRYAESDEIPLRQASVKDFMLSRTEVTVGQWLAVMNELPFGNDRRHPEQAVCNVSWYDAQAFVQELSARTGKKFRLPTEDEWEYAARGGVKSKGYIFAGGNNADEYAVCTKKKNDKASRPSVPDVASKKPNELGLYDMSGNVWEWVRGEYDNGSAVLRGGSRLSTNVACRVSNRQGMEPTFRKNTFGFRIAL